MRHDSIDWRSAATGVSMWFYSTKKKCEKVLYAWTQTSNILTLNFKWLFLLTLYNSVSRMGTYQHGWSVLCPWNVASIIDVVLTAHVQSVKLKQK